MKFLIVLVSTILAVKAAPQFLLHPSLYSHQIISSVPAVVSTVPVVSHYHAQDALGQYSYGYSGGPSAKSEVKTLDGVTRGSYSYIDSNAKLQTVNYVADALGFRVAATNLPVAPVDNGEAPKQVEDTEEVMQARAEHLAAIAKARSESSDPEEADDTETQPEGPKPVEDLPEVKQAREEHLLAVEEAKARNAIAPADIPAPVASKLISPVVVANHVSPVVQYLSAPLAIQAPSSFAYSVYAPGHQQLIYA